MSCLPLDVRVNVTVGVLRPRTTMREPQPTELILGLHPIARIFFFLTGTFTPGPERIQESHKSNRLHS
jgi:hypothetical protein